MSSSGSSTSIVPRCALNGADTNATCMEKVDTFLQPFSSTFALTLLGLVFIGIVSLSLTTYHYHKSKMKRRKMLRAQEEYERDHCSPVPARAKPELRRCVIARPASRDPEPPAPSSTETIAPNPDDVPTVLTRENNDMEAGEAGNPEVVAVS